MFRHLLGFAWPGVSVGLAAGVILLSACAGLFIGTGLGTVADAALGLLAGTLVLLLALPLATLALTLVRRIPLRFVALFVTAWIGVLVVGEALHFSPDVSIRLGAWPVLLLASTGAGVSMLQRRAGGRASAVRRVLAGLLLLATATGAVIFVAWMALPGRDPFRQSIHPVSGAPVAPLDAPDPSLAGPYEVATLFYGSGTDRHRREYGPAVDLQTDGVDASSFVTDSPNDFKSWARRKYWGFDPHCFPRNARVWYPKGDGPFPLVLILHGNHQMEEFSDPGYAYLGELLASRGFIAASIDENFLNRSWSGDLGEEHGVHGWLLLKHLELWRDWNEQKNNPFYHKVNLDEIALIGHSRGGEAITHAAAFNQLTHHPDNPNVFFHFGFGIKTLIALAPTDGLYTPGGQLVPVRDVNYLVLQGSHDSDVHFFAGARCYHRVTFAGDHYRMKAALYIYRADHSQFNTVWGRYDLRPPLGYLLNRASLLSGAQQRTIAQVYVSAFLEATLHGKSDYIPLFRDHRCAAHWLPDTVYFSRFEDSGFRMISSFEDAIDITKTSIRGGTQQGEHLRVWQQGQMVGRGGEPLGDHVVVLGWNRAGGPEAAGTEIPRYTITLPEVSSLVPYFDEEMLLSFGLADTGERGRPAAREGSPWTRWLIGPDGTDTADRSEDAIPVDLTIELVDSDGRVARLPLSRVTPLQPALKVTFTKWPYWERSRCKSPIEPVLQTFEIPLADFVAANPEFDPGRLQQIRFRFDRTQAAVILLDDVGLAHRPDHS